MYREIGRARPVWVFAAFLAGAASASSAAELKETATPPVGAEREIVIGTTVFERVRSTVQPGARPTADVVKRTITGAIRLEAYTPLIIVPSRVKLKACVYAGACALDDDGDGTFDRVSLSDVAAALRLEQPVPYEKVGIGTPSEQDRRQKLTLEDVSEGKIVFRFREERGGLDDDYIVESYSFRIGPVLPQTVTIRDIRLKITAVQQRAISVVRTQ